MFSYRAALRLGAAAAIVAVAAPATYAAGQEQPASQPREARQKGERLICRMLNGQTGTRMGGERVCRTREQWRQYDRENF